MALLTNWRNVHRYAQDRLLAFVESAQKRTVALMFPYISQAQYDEWVRNNPEAAAAQASEWHEAGAPSKALYEEMVKLQEEDVAVYSEETPQGSSLHEATEDSGRA